MTQQQFDYSPVRALLATYVNTPTHPILKAFFDAAVLQIARRSETESQDIDLLFFGRVVARILDAHPELGTAYVESEADEAWRRLDELT